MKISDLQSCLFKYRKHIALLVAIALLMCNLGIYVMQTNTAEVYIKYLGNNAIEGFAEDGSALDPAEIATPHLVKHVLDDMGYDGKDYNKIIKGIKVTPVVPTAEEEKYASWIDNYDDYANDEGEKDFPVYYSITFETEKSEAFARRFLNTLVNRYRQFYAKNHSGKSDVTQLSSDAVMEFDYFETAQILERKINNDVKYLDNIVTGDVDFRSVDTGYSLNDIKSEYLVLKEAYLAGVSQRILEEGIAKNGEILVTTLVNRAENAELENGRNMAKAESESELMKIYSKKNKEYIWDTRYSSDEDGDQVREDTERDKVHNRTKTTYDQLALDYVNYYVTAENLLVDKEYNEKYIEYFENGTADDVTVGEELSFICNKFNELHRITEKILEDYNDYKSSRYVAAVSGVSVDETLNSIIYYTASVLLALGIGIVGALFVELKKKKTI